MNLPGHDSCAPDMCFVSVDTKQENMAVGSQSRAQLSPHSRHGDQFQWFSVTIFFGSFTGFFCLPPYSTLISPNPPPNT